MIYRRAEGQKLRCGFNYIRTALGHGISLKLPIFCWTLIAGYYWGRHFNTRWKFYHTAEHREFMFNMGYSPLRNCKYIMKNGKCNHLERRNIFNRGKQCVLDDSFVKDCTKREGILRPNRPPPPAGVGQQNTASPLGLTFPNRPVMPPPPPRPVKVRKFVSTHKLKDTKGE